MNERTVPTDDETRSRVRGLLQARHGDVMDLVADTDELPLALGDRYDSLNAMECIVAVESEFGIEVDFVAHDVRFSFSTIERISMFVREQLEDRVMLDAPS